MSSVRHKCALWWTVDTDDNYSGRKNETAELEREKNQLKNFVVSSREGLYSSRFKFCLNWAPTFRRASGLGLCWKQADRIVLCFSVSTVLPRLDRPLPGPGALPPDLLDPGVDIPRREGDFLPSSWPELTTCKTWHNLFCILCCVCKSVVMLLKLEEKIVFYLLVLKIATKVWVLCKAGQDGRAWLSAWLLAAPVILN